MCFFLGGGVGGGRRGKGISPLLPLLPTLDWDVRFCNSSLLFSVYTVSSPGRPVGLCLNECSLKSPKQTKCDVVLTLSIPKPSATKSLEEQGSPLCNCWSKVLKNVIHLHKETGVLGSKNFARLPSPVSDNETWRKACHGLNSSLTVFLLDFSNVIKSCYPKYAKAWDKSDYFLGKGPVYMEVGDPRLVR